MLDRSTREVTESPSFEILKARLDVVLSNLLRARGLG